MKNSRQKLNVPTPSLALGRPVILIACFFLLVAIFQFMFGNLLWALRLGGAGIVAIILVEIMRKEFGKK